MITPIDSRRLVAALLACLALALLGAARAPASAGKWRAAEDLSKDDRLKSSPQIAMDPAGDAIVVWERREGEMSEVQSAFRPVGGVWGAPRTIATGGTDPRVAMDGAGNAVVVWSASDGPDEVIQSSFRPAGGEWGTLVTISEKGHDSFSPALAMNTGGDAVAVWSVYEAGVAKSVEGAFRFADSAWRVALTVADVPPKWDPDVGIDGAGNALAVWRTCPPVESDPCSIESAAEPEGGEWDGQTQTIAKELDPGKGPRVTVNPGGDAAVVWGSRSWLKEPPPPPKEPKETKEKKQREELPPIDPAPGKDGLVEGVKGAFRAAGDSWQGSGFLSREGSYPAIAIDGAGHTLALWMSSNAIASAQRMPTGGWQEPVLVSRGSERASYPQLAMSDSGSAIAIWPASEGDSSETARAATWSPSGGWGSPASVTEEGRSAEVTAAIDDGGDATAAWVHYTNFPEAIQAAPYDTGEPESEHLPASSLGASNTPAPTISKLKQSSPIWHESGSPLSASSSRLGSAPLGTTFTVVLDQDATVRLSFRRDGGRRSGALTLSAHSVMNRTGFRGKITAVKRLKPGRYTLTATATNRNGSSAPRSLDFRIVKTS